MYRPSDSLNFALVFILPFESLMLLKEICIVCCPELLLCEVPLDCGKSVVS